jgi:hypothetical protein
LNLGAGLAKNTGHFHLAIDEAAILPAGEKIPFDDKHLHFGEALRGATQYLIVSTPTNHPVSCVIGS